MAGDWIKMRVWLSRDPKVIRMADVLSDDKCFMQWLTDPVRQSCKESAYEHVTRNVIVALCVTSLLVTWGTAREQGDREEDDLVLSHADLLTLDAMTDMPGFGDAMSSVEWAVEREDGALVFPKFFKENESPDDRHRRQNAARQAKHRDKIRNEEVTQSGNVTVTHREEKRREEKTNPSRAPRLELNGAFTAFWESYPRKKSKGDAEKAWLKIKPDEQLTGRILRAVEQAKASPDWQRDSGKFIPYPASWLNAKGWEDETGRVRVIPAGGSEVVV